jgi:molybdopterin/thiamine biosynthesis adenylyltransferase
VTRDVRLLTARFGEDAVVWAADYSWITVAGFSLPPGLDARSTNLLVMVPDGYGYGVPYRELYVDPGLRVWHEGAWREFPGVTGAVLVLTEGDFLRLRDHLLRPDGLERAACGLLGRARAGEAVEFYLHRLFLPHDRDYRSQSAVQVEPEPAWLLGTLHAMERSGAAGYLHAHSHPFSDRAASSVTDDRYLPGEIASVRGYLQACTARDTVAFLRLVWGRREDGFWAEAYDADGRLAARVTRLRVVGQRGIRELRSTAQPGGDEPLGDSAEETLPVARLDRNIRWLGRKGQARLHATRLAVIGAGGIGSAFVAQARGLGFRRFALVDPDRVEASNLNRFFGARLRDVGRLKVKVLAREIRSLDPGTEVEIVADRVESEQGRRAMLRADVIVGGLDSLAARLEAQVVAARYLRPLLDMGSGIVLDRSAGEVRHLGCQVAFYIPGGPCLLCQGVINPARILSPDHQALRRRLGYLEGVEEEAPPSVVTLNALVAALGTDALVRYLSGSGPAPIYLRFDGLAQRLEAIPFRRRPDCPVCGDDGVEGLADDEGELLPPAGQMEASPARPLE